MATFLQEKMMANIEVELLTDQSNFAVLQLPGRKFPGIVVQGDTLNRMISTLNEAVGAVGKGDSGEVGVLLRELATELEAAQSRYEAALRSVGRELPY